MSIKTLDNLGIEVPNDFPFQSYNNIHSGIVPQKDINLDIWSEFGGAWNSVAYKFITLAESDEIYSDSINQFGCTPIPNERFIQHKAQFSFFINAHSLIESFSYALYILGSMKNQQDFPMRKEVITNLSPEKIRDKYIRFYESESITKFLKEIISSDYYKELKEIRNTLIHRTFPGRHMVYEIGGENPDSPAFWIGTNIQIDNQLTASRRVWLANSLSQAMNAMAEFVSKNFPNQ